MLRHDGNQIEIYIGDSVRYASERAVLERVVHLLSAARQPAIILANVSIDGQQIDAVVATGSLALVVESKAFNRPVKGGENGPWQVRLASGQWKNFRNPYLQAREAALAVRDAMGAFNGSDAPYPGAAVVFVPALPSGSEAFPGDFKVSVTGLDGLEAPLRSTQRSAWPIERWRAFATHLRLTPVSSVAAACDRSLAEAEALVRQYSAAYEHTYADPVSVVPFPCRTDEDSISSDDVVRRVAEGQAEFLVQGPSGCGKTLLAGQAGRAFAARGGVAVTLPIRDYAGSLKSLLDREVGLLIGQPATTLLGAARLANRPLLFVVDGYNECVPSEQPSLSRGLAALARRYQANLLVTSQCPVARSDLLPLHAITVAPAAPETKTAIALNVTGGDSLPEQLKPLLESVTTGLEARLIGEVGRDLGGGKSRYALFDLFARKRLAEAATDGIALLSRIAGWLSERIAFSLSNRDLDRLLDEHHMPSVLADRLHAAGLLTRRGDRVSFVHELFLDAFAAEHVLRHAAGDPKMVLHALAAPRNDGRKTLIVGAIDDGTLLTAVWHDGRRHRDGLPDRGVRCVGADVGGTAMRRVVGAATQRGCGGPVSHCRKWLERRCIRGVDLDGMDTVGARLPGRDAATVGGGAPFGRGARDHRCSGRSDRRRGGPAAGGGPRAQGSPSERPLRKRLCRPVRRDAGHHPDLHGPAWRPFPDCKKDGSADNRTTVGGGSSVTRTALSALGVKPRD